MPRSSVNKIILLIYTLLLALTGAQIEPSQLGVRFNKQFAEKTGKFVLGSTATIGGLAEWSDAEIVHLAYQAHEAVAAAFNKDRTLVNKINREKLLARKVPVEKIQPVSIPTVTTVLVIDNTAYISTSMRGGSFLYKPKPAHKTPEGEPRHTLVFKNKIKCAKEVVDALATCQTKAEKDYGQISGHRTGASCGEPMSMLAFCATRTEKDIKTSGARIVSIHNDRKEKPAVVPPCGEWDSEKKQYRSEWGCAALMGKEAGLNIKVIEDTTSTPRDGKQVVSSVANRYM